MRGDDTPQKPSDWHHFFRKRRNSLPACIFTREQSEKSVSFAWFKAKIYLFVDALTISIVIMSVTTAKVRQKRTKSGIRKAVLFTIVGAARRLPDRIRSAYLLENTWFLTVSYHTAPQRVKRLCEVRSSSYMPYTFFAPPGAKYIDVPPFGARKSCVTFRFLPQFCWLSRLLAKCVDFCFTWNNKTTTVIQFRLCKDFFLPFSRSHSPHGRRFPLFGIYPQSFFRSCNGALSANEKASFLFRGLRAGIYHLIVALLRHCMLFRYVSRETIVILSCRTIFFLF